MLRSKQPLATSVAARRSFTSCAAIPRSNQAACRRTKSSPLNASREYKFARAHDASSHATSPQVRTYITDALGSVIAQANSNNSADQSIETRYSYSPYGQTNQTGAEQSTAEAANATQYTSLENDKTGLYYYRARYYDPVLKRFISEDPIGLAGGMNVFGYVNGNPVSLTDPSGLQSAGVQVSFYNGLGGNFARSADGTTVVNAGVGFGAGVTFRPDVRLPGSGQADATIGFSGGFNFTLGPLSCVFNCSAGMEIFRDPNGRVSTQYYENCSFSPRAGGQRGTGMSATANGGVTVGIGSRR